MATITICNLYIVLGCNDRSISLSSTATIQWKCLYFQSNKNNVFDNRERWLFVLILQKHWLSPNQNVFLLLIILNQIKAFSSVGKYKVSNFDGGLETTKTEGSSYRNISRHMFEKKFRIFQPCPLARRKTYTDLLISPLVAKLGKKEKKHNWKIKESPDISLWFFPLSFMYVWFFSLFHRSLLRKREIILQLMNQKTSSRHFQGFFSIVTQIWACCYL